MTAETQQYANPMDPEQFAHGGGLWDGKRVTITKAIAKTEALAYKDGKPVLDDKGQQSIQTALFITGVAEGLEDRERTEAYSAGDKVTPTADGTGFVDKETGGAPKFHANSNIAKLGAALKASGFDIGLLWDATAGRQRFDRLVGAQFVMRAEAKLGRDGKPLKDKKGYDKAIFLPAKFVGYVAAHGTYDHAGTVAGKAGNGSGGDALTAKADAAVIAALAGGPLSRADLVRTLANTLGADQDANAIIGLVVQDSYHKGKAWSYDGVTAKL